MFVLLLSILTANSWIRLDGIPKFDCGLALQLASNFKSQNLKATFVSVFPAILHEAENDINFYYSAFSVIFTKGSKVERFDTDPPKQGTGHWDQMRRPMYEKPYVPALLV